MTEPRNVADSFEEEVANLLPEVAGFFSRRIPSEADDCAAETLVAALAARASFRGEASVRTFVFRIAHRVLGRRIRLLARYEQDVDLQHIDAVEDRTEASHVGGLFDQIVEDVIADALTLMEDAPKEMLELTFVEGKSRRQLATHLDLPTGTVAGRLQRARSRLRSLIKDAARRRLTDDDSLSLAAREILRELAEGAES